VSGEVRTLHGRVFSDIVDGLHDVVAQLGATPFALVGGVAVLVHVQGHRVTKDIDSAVRGEANDIRERLLVVAEPPSGRDATVVLPNGIPVDVLADGYAPIRRGLGLRTSTGLAVRWAIETRAAGDRGGGPAQFPRARDPAGRETERTHRNEDRVHRRPRWGDKRATDLLDLWRLLSDDPIGSAEILEELRAAPADLQVWARNQLAALFDEDPACRWDLSERTTRPPMTCAFTRNPPPRTARRRHRCGPVCGVARSRPRRRTTSTWPNRRQRPVQTAPNAEPELPSTLPASG
jgi:hypothetical protein